MMPCRKNKCLLQAVCKSKIEIHCSEFLSYVESKYKVHGETSYLSTSRINRRVWARLHKTHPNLKRVYASEPSDDIRSFSIESQYNMEWEWVNK